MTAPTADDLRAQLAIYSAIHAAMIRWPEVSALAAGAREPDDARRQLRDLLGVSDVEANAILEMQLRRVTVLEREKIASRIRDLEDEITELENRDV